MIAGTVAAVEKPQWVYHSVGAVVQQPASSSQLLRRGAVFLGPLQVTLAPSFICPSVPEAVDYTSQNPLPAAFWFASARGKTW